MKKIIIIVLIAAIGIITALYTHIWNPSWNPFRPIPGIVLTKMALNMKELESFHIRGDFNLKSGNTEIETGIALSTDITESRLEGVIDLPMPSTEVRFIRIDQVFYLELGTLSLHLEQYLIESMESEIVGEGLNGKWIKIDIEATKDIAEILSIWTGEEITINEELYEKKWQEFTSEMSELFLEKDFYDIKEELPDEEIENELFYHYLVTLNQEGVKELASEMTMVTLKYFPADCRWTRDKSFILDVDESIQENIDNYFEALDSIDLEIWISQKDNYLHRIKFEETELENGDVELILMDINLSQFNQIKRIETPKDFINSQKILERIREELKK